MIAIDWVLLGIVGVSALFGLMRGMIGVLASLAAWLLAGWAAFQFGAQVALLLAGDGEPSAGQLFAGYALAFVVVMVVVGILGWMLRTLVHSVGLSGVDRILGLALGTVRGAVIACALLLLLGLSELPREPSWQQSRVVPLLLPGAQQLRAFLPAWVADQVDLQGDAARPALLSSDHLSMLKGAAAASVGSGSPVRVDQPARGGAATEQPLPTPAPSRQRNGGQADSVLAPRGD